MLRGVIPIIGGDNLPTAGGEVTVECECVCPKCGHKFKHVEEDTYVEVEFEMGDYHRDYP